jgi:hypothetical protein
MALKTFTTADGSANQALVTNGSGVLSFAAVGGGLSEADAWRINTNMTFTNPGTTFVTSNWERVDTDGFDKIGTGLSESSGVFSFPSTGYYYITHFSNFSTSNARLYVSLNLHVTLDNSTYTYATINYGNLYDVSSYTSNSASFIIKVTNTANIKFKFQVDRSESVQLEGSSTQSLSGFTCIKLAGV